MYWKSIQTGTTCLLLAGLAALPCKAQIVQGAVVNDRSHAPIGFAHLELLDDSGHVVARDVSDSASGSFYLSASTPGRYRVKILLGHGGLSYSPPFDLDTNRIVEHLFAVPDFPRAV